MSGGKITRSFRSGDVIIVITVLLPVWFLSLNGALITYVVPPHEAMSDGFSFLFIILGLIYTLIHLCSCCCCVEVQT